MTTIVAPPSNASKWQMGFNSAFKGLKPKRNLCLRFCLKADKIVICEIARLFYVNEI
jgi:hypothetical protein